MKRLLIIALIVTCWSRLSARTFIVCAAINDYPTGISDLSLCVNDLMTIKGIYEANNHAHVESFINYNATTHNILAAMRRLYLQANADDVVLFYFSGHGTPGTFVCYDGILPYKSITDIMKRSRARTKIIMADACYSGSIRANRRHNNSYSSTNVMLFLSSRSNELSIEIPRWKNGVFTTFLESGLRGKADVNNDRRITARELFNYVSQSVKRVTRNKQHPVMWGKFDSNMVILKW